MIELTAPIVLDHIMVDPLGSKEVVWQIGDSLWPSLRIISSRRTYVFNEPKRSKPVRLPHMSDQPFKSVFGHMVKGITVKVRVELVGVLSPTNLILQEVKDYEYLIPFRSRAVRGRV